MQRAQNVVIFYLMYIVLTNLCNKYNAMNYTICIPMDVYVPVYSLMNEFLCTDVYKSYDVCIVCDGLPLR